MNFKKIIVYQYDTLFNILDEIKEKFNFDIFNANKENLDDIKKNLGEDFILISKNPIQNLQDYFLIDETPLKIERLIEQLNLKFLKNKFNTQSDIEVGVYKINLNSREISKNNNKIPLTEREINLIIFLNKAKNPVKIDELQKKVWEYSSELETHTVETHVYRLRKKIKEKFNDENFILSLKDGYLIR